MKLRQTEKTKVQAADKAGMDVKTARKYARVGKMPSEVQTSHTWRTRKDPFWEVWEEMRGKLAESQGELEAKALFEHLQRERPGDFSDGQLRTLQRRTKRWRALEGPSHEVFFPQVYRPGGLCESDFTHMDALGITICGVRFDHMIYHLVLVYSNWETGTVCFSESFESLSEGLQNGLWELGRVPERHQTDRLTSEVNKMPHPEEFTARYSALLRHYGLEGKRTNRNSPNENGDVEQRNYRLKRTVEQALLMRGSRDFSRCQEYDGFLRMLFARMNSNRCTPFAEELKVLHGLPEKRLEACKREQVRKELRLPTVRECYQESVRMAEAEHLSYEQYLLTVIEQECDVRRTNRIGRLLRELGLPLEKTLSMFDRSRLTHALNAQVTNLLDGSFLTRRENVLAFDNSGSGKSHLLCAIAHELIHQEKRIRFTPCSLLVQELLIAKRDLKLARVLKRLARYDAIFIDDVGYVQQNREEMEVLFTLLADRYERGSVMITSNLPFSQWERIFKDPATTAAAVDRFVHHSVIIELNLESHCPKESKTQKTTASSQRRLKDHTPCLNGSYTQRQQPKQHSNSMKQDLQPHPTDPNLNAAVDFNQNIHHPVNQGTAKTTNNYE
jgi:DNA replication protein DnaC